MRKIIYLCALLTFTLTGCVYNPNNANSNHHDGHHHSHDNHHSNNKDQNFVGGWSNVNTNSKDVKQVTKFAASHVKTKQNKIKSILNAQQQVVAGMNYKVTFLTHGNKKYKAQVYKDLKGKLSLTYLKKIK